MTSKEHKDSTNLPGTSQRLSSIRPARDLTLGGVPKKTFTPKIPSRSSERVSKSTNATNSSNSTEPKKKDLIKENVAVRNESQQRYQTKPRSNTTSKSVTSQRTVFSFRKSNEGKSDSKTFMRGDVNKVTVKTEKMDVDDLDNVYSEDELNDPVNEENYTLPVQLPLSKSRKGKDLNTHITIKQEHPNIKPKLAGDITPAQILTKESIRNDSEKLLLIQLPDLLPLIPQNLPDESSIEENKVNLSSLRNAKDGLIGKLQVRRSGKTSLVIGNIPYKLRSGTKCDFLQDLASIKTIENDGYVINLGPIKHRLVCTPDVDELLKSSH